MKNEESVYYFSSSSNRSANRFRRSLEEYESECVNISTLSAVPKKIVPLVDFHTCEHPKSMIDESSNTCMSCGIWIGVMAAPSSEGGAVNFGNHYHAFSPATASAVARKKKIQNKSNMIVPRVINVCVNPTLSLAFSSSSTPDIYDRRRTLACNMIPNVSNVNQRLCPYLISSALLSPFIDSKLSPRQKRAAAIQFAANSAFLLNTSPPSSSLTADSVHDDDDDHDDIYFHKLAVNKLDGVICTGAFYYLGREPCPVSVSLMSKRVVEMKTKGGDDTLVTTNDVIRILQQQNAEIVETINTFVSVNSEYFNMPQRRRLHNVSLFVAAIACHVKVVHGGNIESARECLELDRLQNRIKPSQSKLAHHSLAAAIGDRVGVNSACATRLTREACKLLELNAAAVEAVAAEAAAAACTLPSL